jgi:hypothetical protein
MIILKWILKKSVWEGVNWIDLAQGMDKWRALVNTVLKPWGKHTLWAERRIPNIKPGYTENNRRTLKGKLRTGTKLSTRIASIWMT